MVALGRPPHSWLEDLIRAGDLRPLLFHFFFPPVHWKKRLPARVLFAAGVV